MMIELKNNIFVYAKIQCNTYIFRDPLQCDKGLGWLFKQSNN